MNNGKKPIPAWMKIAIGICIAIGIYLFIWLTFQLNGPFSSGSELSKDNWLNFFGSYLGFAGTTIVSFTALYVSIKNEKDNTKNRIEGRFKEIQPFFSIDCVGAKVDILNFTKLGQYITPNKSEQLNTQIKVKNIGKFPVLNVILCGVYVLPCLVPGEEHIFTLAPENSYDSLHTPDKVITVESYTATFSNDGYIDKIAIQYDDLDGNYCGQHHTLVKSPAKWYYKFSELEVYGEKDEVLQGYRGPRG